MKKVTLYGLNNETLTVGELISKLSQLPFDRPVFVDGIVQQPIVNVGEDNFQQVYIKTSFTIPNTSVQNQSPYAVSS